MKIVADENIPCVEQAFASLGEVQLLPGRAMQATDVRDAEILLVRSVTRVDAALLDGSRVRFVGSATIGFDHVDRDWLQRHGIGFATAPGSNATSAAEYVVSALLVLCQQRGFSLAGRSVGIVGCGNVGSRVRARLTALGMECRVNDPPLQARGECDEGVTLEQALQADVVSLHVPLERGGPHPTYHLLDEARLAQLRDGAILVNTARGAAIDTAALHDLLSKRDDLAVVLDVWEHEPAISAALLQQVVLGTPHIAGYSLDGKLRGTEMIYRAACAYLGQVPAWQAASSLPPVQTTTLACEGLDTREAVSRAVLSVYDVRDDDRRLRETLALPVAERAAAFDALRKHYPPRREFAATGLQLQPERAEVAAMLVGLGFRLPVGA